MIPELVVVTGSLLASGLTTRLFTREAIVHSARQMVTEYRFEKIIDRGYMLRILAPSTILAVTLLSAIAIGQTSPLEIENIYRLVGDSLILSLIVGSMLGAIEGADRLIDIGTTLKVLYPDKQPRVVIDSSATDIETLNFLE